MHSETIIRRKNQKIKLVGLFIFLTTIILSCVLTFAVEDKIVAIVNGEAITQKDIQDYLSALYIQLSYQYDKDKLDSMMKEAQNQAIDTLIEDRLIIQEARRQELKADDYIVQRELDDIKSRFQSQKEFEEGLTSQGLTLADIKNKIADRIIMHDIVEKEVRSKIFVHPQEVTDYYQSHIENFQIPEQIELDSIFIPFDRSESEAKDTAYKVLALLKKGEDFSKIQKEYSKRESIGLIERDHLKKEIKDAVLGLNVADISVPVKVDDGFFILKIKNIIPAYSQELSKVQDVIYGFLFQSKFEERFIKWIDELKERAFILIK